MATKKPSENRDDPHRQIIPQAEDMELFLWLEELFHLSPLKAGEEDVGVKPGEPKKEPDTFPERIELRPMFGGKDWGDTIEHQEWKPMQSSLPSRESIVQLANKLRAVAQRECNKTRHRKYAVFAFSSLKGASPYKRFTFEMMPVRREFDKANQPAADDDDTHRDRQMQMMMEHNRWLVEQQTEAMSGVMKLQQDIIRQQAETIARQDAERRQWIITSEEALSRKQEREITAEKAKLWNETVRDGIGMLKGLLPAVQIYLTKGQMGIVEGLKKFMEDLSTEAEEKLFGKWDKGQQLTAGILDREQIGHIIGIIEGKVDPKTIGDFVAGLRPDQMSRASEVLTQVQIQSLMALAGAANSVQQPQEGEQVQ